jgi:hypothetical protein
MTLMRIALLAAPLAAGCATIEYGGFFLEKSDAEWAFDQVRNRATFELHCPREKIELVVLNSLSGLRGTKRNPTSAQQIGASGCEQRAVYVASHSGWVLDSTATNNQSQK